MSPIDILDSFDKSGNDISLIDVKFKLFLTLQKVLDGDFRDKMFLIVSSKDCDDEFKRILMR